jgi:hypothetical protein
VLHDLDGQLGLRLRTVATLGLAGVFGLGLWAIRRRLCGRTEMKVRQFQGGLGGLHTLELGDSFG